MPSAWLILPTYNEADNLPRIAPLALAALEQIGLDVTLLVVDDASPDGTGRIADELAEHDARIRVLHRRGKEGIGPAYVAGFEEALAGGAELLLQMDADFSHDPADLPRLVAPVAAGEADLVLGSRYAPGGRIERWGSLRRAVSRVGCWYAQAVLGVDVRDLTGGFKCIHRRVFAVVAPRTLRTNGYGFQIEVTYRALRAGMRVREVPITFRERERGKSKMSMAIALEAAWRVPALRLRVARSHSDDIVTIDSVREETAKWQDRSRT